MTRTAFGRLAACLTTGLFAAALGPFAILTPAVAADETPLQVSIDSMEPSTIPARGPILITGQITNTSDERWVDLNAYLVTSASAFTTRAELAEANGTDATLDVGSRLTDPGLFDPVGDLAPGSSTDYTLSVPRAQLGISGEAGVYWIGVHVLGGSPAGRDGTADGRARTFMPLMNSRGPSTTMSVAVPVKSLVQRKSDGTLTDLDGWFEQLSPGGRLGRILEFSGTAFGVPLTWVVDPAVLDAANTAASDNAVMSTGPTDTEEPGDDSSASASPTPEPPDLPEPPDPPESPKGLSDGARGAADWLQNFQRQASQHTVLSVPYGDLDVASALGQDFGDLYEEATALSAQTMKSFGIRPVPGVAPPSGYLPERIIDRLDRKTPVMLSDAAVPDGTSAVVETDDGHQVLLTDSAGSGGGPGPTAPYSTLAVRQRVISEAALHALSGEREQPLVVSMPQDWDPGPDWRIADFFAGLDVGWLSLRDVPGVLADSRISDAGDEQASKRFAYPPSQRRAEIPISNLLATRELDETGKTFSSLLTRNDTVDLFLGKSALLASSANVRRLPRAAATRTRETTLNIRARMEHVRIDGPPFVTMSSEQGSFTVTLINDLKEPVTVGIEADTSTEDLVIPSPEPVELGAGQRATVRLRATSKHIGVHSVALVPTTADGRPLGNETSFNVRSSQVGLVIWVIMGIGAGILVVTSGIRIAKRVRRLKGGAAPGEPLPEGTG